MRSSKKGEKYENIKKRDVELVGVGDCKMVFISLWYCYRFVLVRIFQTIHTCCYHYRPSLGGRRTRSLAKEINT